MKKGNRKRKKDLYLFPNATSSLRLRRTTPSLWPSSMAQSPTCTMQSGELKSRQPGLEVSCLSAVCADTRHASARTRLPPQAPVKSVLLRKCKRYWSGGSLESRRRLDGENRNLHFPSRGSALPRASVSLVRARHFKSEKCCTLVSLRRCLPSAPPAPRRRLESSLQKASCLGPPTDGVWRWGTQRETFRSGGYLHW